VTGSVLAVAAVTISTWFYIASAPDRAQAQFERGMHQMGAGAYRDAVKSFDHSISIWPYNAAVFFNRGVAHRILSVGNAGDGDAAIADLSRAIAENSSFGQAYTERGAIFEERGDLERAMQDFTRAVELEPSADGYFQRGQAYALMGQPQKAVEDFDRAILERPDAPYIYRARGVAKRSLGDLAGYASDRDQSVKLEAGDFPRAWVDLPLPSGAPSADLQRAPSDAPPKPPPKANQRNTRGGPGPSPPEGRPSH
jgi:tetratricopeptide (TPR) repeat protein